MSDDTFYMPSNSTEGAIFEERFCENGCRYYRDATCILLIGAYAGIQPKEWIYDKETICGICTKFNNAPRKRSPNKNNQQIQMEIA